MECPRCGFDSPEAGECLRCGVVFAKLREPSKAGSLALDPDEADDPRGETSGTVYEPSPEGAESEAPGPRSLPAEAGRVLGIGFVLAVVILLVPLLRFVLSYIAVLVHELGHSATSWLLGDPAVPAFDFSYGGGVSMSFGRHPMLVTALIAAWGGWLWHVRHARRLRLVVAGLALLWGVAVFTVAGDALVLIMGHGAEVLFAGLCLWRALTGDGTRRPEAERPLYAMVGWFLLLQGVAFAWGLLTDPARRQLYEEAKGGGHWMDFSRLARDVLRIDLAVPATLYLLACLAVPPVVWLLHRHGARWLEGLEDWLGRGEV